MNTIYTLINPNRTLSSHTTRFDRDIDLSNLDKIKKNAPINNPYKDRVTLSNQSLNPHRANQLEQPLTYSDLQHKRHDGFISTVIDASRLNRPTSNGTIYTSHIITPLSDQYHSADSIQAPLTYETVSSALGVDSDERGFIHTSTINSQTTDAQSNRIFEHIKSPEIDLFKKIEEGYNNFQFIDTLA